MTKTTEDALEVLQQTLEEIDLDLDFSLVRACYEIEREHQYEHDREIPLSKLRQLVTVTVEREIESRKTGEVDK